MSTKLQSNSFKKKRQRRIFWLVFLSIVIIVSWTVSLVSFTKLKVFRINDVQIFGADEDISASIKSAATDALQGNYLGYFPYSSTIIYPRSTLVGIIKKSSPRVDDVEIKRDGLHSLIITVSERTPSAIVCAGLPDWESGALSFSANDECYYVDHDSYVYQKIKNSVDVTSNIYFVSDIGLDSYIASSTKFSILQNIFSQSKSVDIPASALLIKDGGEYELYASSTIIYLTDTADLTKEIENLTLFWTNMRKTYAAKGKIMNFSDIKLQYPPNVYYTEVK